MGGPQAGNHAGMPPPVLIIKFTSLSICSCAYNKVYNVDNELSADVNKIAGVIIK